MARDELVLRFFANDEERSITFLDPPTASDIRRYERFIRDMHRMQWFAHRNGFSQTPECWKGMFDQEEYVSVIRYLERFEWKRDSTSL